MVEKIKGKKCIHFIRKYVNLIAMIQCSYKPLLCTRIVGKNEKKGHLRVKP